MSEVRFGLLGPFQVLVDDDPLTIPSPAERALLTLLLLSPGRVVGATNLIARLWADESLPRDPANALQLRISKLRRTLAERTLPAVQRIGAGYRLDVDPDATDAEQFALGLRAARTMSSDEPDRRLRAYEDVLGLWRGPALADFTSEPWAPAEAARLEEMRLAALAEHAHLAIALGRQAEVISDLEPLVSADPTQEAMAGLLMVALYRSGRQADALEVYTRTRRVLDDELGLEPSASLRSLHERVLRQDESLGGAADIVVPPSVTVHDRGRGGAASAPSRLPALLSPLIGRAAELEQLRGLVAESRLVTLVGPGGAGKTTLAMAVAPLLTASFRDGAFLARLAPVREPRSVATTTADAIGVSLDGTAADEVRARITQYLQPRQALLVVDNCEHVIDAAATLIEEILARCPDVTVLATSREALAVSSEIQVSVGPLATAPEDVLPEDVLDYPASQLFLRRATAMRPGFTLDNADLQALGRVCRALDGMPLALELASARITSMSISEIADRIDQRFSLLTVGARTAEDRQRTLRATVDWSYDLLTELERSVFGRLSVFQGGWTLESAEAVLSDSVMSGADVLHALSRLVEQSLVVAEPGRTTRYRMLETLREYAAQRLSETEGAPGLQRRHAEYFRDSAVSAATDLRGPGQRQSLRRLRDEHANIRAALTWFSSAEGEQDEALRLAGSLGLFWHLGRHLEGRDLLRRLLDSPGGSASGRAMALQALSLVERPRACIVHPNAACAQAARESLDIFEREGRDSDAALSRVLLAVEGVKGSDPSMDLLLAEAHRQFRADGDEWGQAVVDFVRMEAALKQGTETEALDLGRRAATAFRRLEDAWGLSAVLYHLGWGLRQFGRYEEAARALEEAIDVGSSVGLDNNVQWALADLGVAHVHRGDLDAAHDCFTRARTVSDRVGDGAGAVLADYGHGLIDLVDGRWTEALKLLSDAAAGFERLGTPVMRGQAVLGTARCLEGMRDLDAAEGAYTEAATLGERAGEPGVTSAAWEGLARITQARGDTVPARDLLNRASALRLASHRPPLPHEQPELEVSPPDSGRTAPRQ